MRVLTAETQRELRERRCAGEAAEVLGERRTRPLNIERSQCMEIATWLRGYLRDAAREEVQRAAVAAPAAASAARERRLDPELARRDPHDARGLEIVEDVQDDGIGPEEGHAA